MSNTFKIYNAFLRIYIDFKEAKMIDISGETLVAIVALAGTICVALLNGFITYVSAPWLETRREKKHATSAELLNALYNELVHMFLFMINRPQVMAAEPEKFFNLDAYEKAREDPIKFFMLSTAHELDNFYMAMHHLKEELNAAKAGSIDEVGEAIVDRALRNACADIACNEKSLEQIDEVIKHIPREGQMLKDMLDQCRNRSPKNPENIKERRIAG